MSAPNAWLPKAESAGAAAGAARSATLGPSWPCPCSRSRSRSMSASLQLRLHLAAEKFHQRRILELGGEAGRAAVPAAAQRAGDLRDVNAVVGRAQGHLAARWPAAVLGQQVAHQA